MKKGLTINRIIIAIIIVLIMSFALQGTVYAAAEAGSGGGGSTGGPLSKFNGKITGASGAKSGIETLLGTVLTGIRFVGAGIAICILSYVGIKYMLASAGERAELKNYMLRYVIGAVILLSATFIVTELIKLAQSITGT